MEPKRFHRRPPRLDRVFQSYDPPVYFVTFCTHQRKKILAYEGMHEAFIDFARRALHDHSIAVGRYVIMPDHIHLFVTGDHDFVLGHWVATLKRVLARALTGADQRAAATPGAMCGKRPVRIWQEGFFDHLLRSDESMGEKWDYIQQNPVRAGLATQPDHWPYQGEIIPIDRT